MPVEVKTLSGHTFQLDCSNGDSIKEVKEKIAARDDLPEKYNAELLKLLYSGRVLEDEKSLGSYSMKDDGYLVLVKRTPGRIPPPKKEPLPSFDNPFGSQLRSPLMSAMPGLLGPNEANPFPMPSFLPTQQAIPSLKPFSDSSSHASSHVPSHTSAAAWKPAPSNDVSDEHLQTLVSMGFNKEQSRAALEAASYDFQRALDLLTTEAVPKTEEKKGSLPEVAEKRRSSKVSLINRNQPSSTPDEDDIEEEEENGAGVPSANGEAMSQMFRDDPQKLQVLKESLKDQNPAIARMIDDDPEGFLKMMGQISLGPSASSADGGVAAAPPGSITVNLSPKDQAAIANLESMGFERNRSIEAYLCCERNEEMAANYLLGAFD